MCIYTPFHNLIKQQFFCALATHFFTFMQCFRFTSIFSIILHQLLVCLCEREREKTWTTYKKDVEYFVCRFVVVSYSLKWKTKLSEKKIEKERKLTSMNEWILWLNIFCSSSSHHHHFSASCSTIYSIWKPK